MNIGVMQLSTINVSKPVASASPQSNEMNQPSNFGQVFNSIVSNTSTNNQQNTGATETMNIELTEVLNAQSLEELLDLLDIPHDQGLLMLQVGEEGQAVAMDELMDMNAILDILNISQEELNHIVGQLLGEEDVAIFNIWQFVELVNEQAPKVLGELNAALQGEGSVSPKDAAKLLEFLKLTQLAGKQSDLVSTQPEQLSQLKELLAKLSTNIDGKPLANDKQFENLLTNNQAAQSEANKPTAPSEQSETTKTTVPSVQSETNKQTVQSTQTETKTTAQGLQQVVTKTETTETQGLGTTTTQQTATKTVAITLPNTNQAAQSEALVKEMQNLLNRSQMSTTQGTTKLLLKLYPENLGSIRIEIMQKDGMLTARLLASTAMGKELLDGQIHQLRNAFVQANIQMERIDIAQSLQETDLKRDQSLFSNLFNQQPQEDEEQSEEENGEEEQLTFKDYLVNEEV